MFSAAQVRRRHQQWIRRVESLLANRDRIEAKDSLAAVNRRCRHRSSNRRPERYIICHTQKKSLGYDSVMEESNRWNSSTVASSSPGFIFFFLSPPPRRSLPYYSHANTFFFFTKSQGNYAKVLRNLHAEQLSKVQWKHQQECELLEDLRYTLSLICKWFYKCTQKTLYIHETEAYVLVVADELLDNWLELFSICEHVGGRNFIKQRCAVEKSYGEVRQLLQLLYIVYVQHTAQFSLAIVGAGLSVSDNESDIVPSVRVSIGLVRRLCYNMYNTYI